MSGTVEFIAPYLPLKIDNVSWNGDVLLLSSTEWSLRVDSVWRILAGKKMLFGCWDDDANKIVADLEGLSVTSVFWVTPEEPIDLSLVLSNGTRLEVLCCLSFEPWVVNLPDNSVFVGNS
ncbi:hypothetical protein [Microbulbifer halophilus]|uniref:Uncharacterized protein n=1 Tax=Microbulbifer halophilus TaxID=453963 RepID=A0ABW5EEX9_9GAMM|nr:hypothetical protein [Microbulbifer halophilus]MCW8125935.1 hypothetical protein [Microbulbifer halophilus]